MKENLHKLMQSQQLIQAYLWQIHTSERIDRHRKLSQKAVHLACHAVAFPTEDDYLIGLG